ncbi:MAG: prepilin-type N-terminal cleavage/methylation domain-containing protein [Gemmatimonadetes bacterium]|nr:prepilin-type N-terminal cleavage/methylation domain-containing protein [Gemmatimonadota bacterium]
MNRKGFTLVETLVALIILTVVALSLGRFVGNFLHVVGTSTMRTVATAVAQEQIETIRSQTSATAYPTMVSTYNNQTVTGFPGFAAMTRLTRVTRTTSNSPRADYTTITVTVSEPRMGTPVNLTVVVAAP